MFTTIASTFAWGLSLHPVGAAVLDSESALEAAWPIESTHAIADETALNYTFAPEPTTSRPVLHLGALQDNAIQPLQEPENDKPPAFGTKGTWRLNLQAHIGEDLHNEDNQQYLGGVGFSYFVEQDLSLDFEFNGLYFNQEVGSDETGFNFSLLLRWHFLMRENWSLYADGGAGLLLSTGHIPTNGSSFNFTPQAGLGASFDVGHNNRLMVGTRWHHISNANLYDDNPGRDSIIGYVALSIPF